MKLMALWKQLSANWLVSFIHKCILLFFAFGGVMIIMRWKLLPPAVPLWYSRPWGVEQLAGPLWLFLLPVGGLMVYGVNVWVSLLLLYEYPVFTRVLFLSSLLVNLLCLLTLINILFLVT
ncbi:MAG: hypothetical protein AAB457_00535 [Patescibacteria group bacterium]